MLATGSAPLTLQRESQSSAGAITTNWVGSNGVRDTLVAPAGATLDVQPIGSGYQVVVAPPAALASTTGTQSASSAVSPASSGCYNGANGLSIPDGCVFDTYSNTFYGGHSVSFFAFKQTMSQNVARDVLVSNSINASVSNNGVPAEYAAVYDEWPGSTGNTYAGYSPQSIIQSSTGATVSVSLNAPHFSYSQTEPIFDAESGYDFPHGSGNPAFGAFWEPLAGNTTGTQGTAISSATEIKIGTGQSDLADVVQVDN
jgi:hypothetical protein